MNIKITLQDTDRYYVVSNEAIFTAVSIIDFGHAGNVSENELATIHYVNKYTTENDLRLFLDSLCGEGFYDLYQYSAF